MEPIAKKWYDNLAQGKITGAKCKDCGKITFPPLTVCHECRSRNLESIEMSGRGTVIMFSSTILPAKQFADLAPIPYGMVQLEEGPCFFTKVEGVDCSSNDAVQKENEKLPAPAKAKIVKVKGTDIVIFEKI